MACCSKAAIVLYFFTSSGRLRRARASSAACRQASLIRANGCHSSEPATAWVHQHIHEAPQHLPQSLQMASCIAADAQCSAARAWVQPGRHHTSCLRTCSQDGSDAEHGCNWESAGYE